MSDDNETKEMNEEEKEERYKFLRREISNLRESIQSKLLSLSKKGGDINLESQKDANLEPKFQRGPQFRCRRKLEGHFGKIYALHWSYDEWPDLVSASQDGKLLIWNTETQHKKLAINLKSSWVMTCCYSFNNKFVASAGLDSMCSIYDVSRINDDDDDSNGWYSDRAYRELIKHEGYISSNRFINNEQILTSSGDATCILWDIEKNKPFQQFKEFDGDIECMEVNIDKSLFIAGSIDGHIKGFDHRDKNCIFTLKGGIYTDGDINCIKFFPDGDAFVYASDNDHSVYLFDLKSFTQITKYGGNNDSIKSSPISMDFTQSGYYLCVGYDDNNIGFGGGGGNGSGNTFCCIYNTQTQQIEKQLAHDSKVSCIQTASNGFSIATGCWDKTVRIWA